MHKVSAMVVEFRRDLNKMPGPRTDVMIATAISQVDPIFSSWDRRFMSGKGSAHTHRTNRLSAYQTFLLALEARHQKVKGKHELIKAGILLVQPMQTLSKLLFEAYTHAHTWENNHRLAAMTAWIRLVQIKKHALLVEIKTTTSHESKHTDWDMCMCMHR